MQIKLSGFHQAAHRDKLKTKLIAQVLAWSWKAMRDEKYF